MSEIALSIVDIAPFLHGDATARRAVGKQFRQAFETSGFAVIVGHGIPEQLAVDTYDAMKAFFALPEAAKRACTIPEKTKSSGYLPIGIESVAKTLTGETPPDLCEALVFRAPHREALSPYKNIYPPEPARLRPLVEAWSAAMLDLTQQLMRLSAIALDLPADYLDASYRDPSLALRFVHYPDQPDEPKPGQLRYGAHHDYGGLTILRQDAAPGGLQIRDRDGVWKEVGIVPNSFIINVGDLMARWTNDRWRSTLHRVSNPPRHLTGSTARLSMVTFTAPHEATEIVCLPSCESVGNPRRYAPVGSGDYVLGKIAASMELTPAE
jgi:isopenicillin N synthase-like dioxygenase